MATGESPMVSADIAGVEWTNLGVNSSTLECRILLCPEDGGYVAFVTHLPGVISQGNTKEEAVNNAMEAFRETILEYRKQGVAIPWGKVEVDRAAGSLEQWIIVNV